MLKIYFTRQTKGNKRSNPAVPGPVTSSRSLQDADKRKGYKRAGRCANVIALNEGTASVGWKPTDPASRSLQDVDKRKDYGEHVGLLILLL